ITLGQASASTHNFILISHPVLLLALQYERLILRLCFQVPLGDLFLSIVAQ
ncbi:hypothetical protein D049_3780B, partial [Vibrio parahaemolyticus VPTS-2010]